MGQSTRHAVGAFTGTGAAVNVIGDKVGFKPSYVKLINITSHFVLEWIEGMAAAAGHKTILDGTQSDITTGGITVAATGFALGTDSINGLGETIYYVCHD